MSDILKINKKCRPNLSDCAVKPLDREVHEYLIGSYLLWPITVAIGNVNGNMLVLTAICAAFLVLGFLFYNLLVAMVKMSHDKKKRLRISQWIFCLSWLVLALRVAWVAG